MVALELTWTKLLVAAVGTTGGAFIFVNQLFWADGHWKGTVDAELKSINARFDKVDARFNKMDVRFDKLEGKIDKMLPILYRLEQKLSPPKGKD